MLVKGGSEMTVPNLCFQMLKMWFIVQSLWKLLGFCQTEDKFGLIPDFKHDYIKEV